MASVLVVTTQSLADLIEPAGLPWTMEDYAIAESKNNGIETHGGAVQRPGGSSGHGEWGDFCE